MMTIRPARLSDLDRLEQLAEEVGVGMTSLPAKREALEEKIRNSMASFSQKASEPGGEIYLLLLEDAEKNLVVGSCAILSTVGITRPFYSFRIINLVHTSKELQKYEPVEVLQMVDEYRGATEVATLYLTPQYRKDRNGRLLSRCRFLLLAEFPARFDQTVLAEMRGVQDERGHSVFWDSIGRHFFKMDFSKADYLSSLGNYQFIADLMPKYPIYVRLLPKAAQQVIGVTHEATRPALEMLKREGFRFEGCVDIFDAGPTVHCPLNQIRTVSDSLRAPITKIDGTIASQTMLIANTRTEDFRACRGQLMVKENGGVTIERKVAEALNVGIGDHIRYVVF